jgi:hypothetical protein
VSVVLEKVVAIAIDMTNSLQEVGHFKVCSVEWSRAEKAWNKIGEMSQSIVKMSGEELAASRASPVQSMVRAALVWAY